MFERFTPGAREVVVTAQAEAIDLAHDRIGTEHLVLALAGAPVGCRTREVLDGFGVTADSARQQLLRMVGDNGLDPDAMRAVGIDLAEITRRTEAQFGPGALDGGAPGSGASRRANRRKSKRTHIPFTTEAKRALELALREAISLRHKEISDLHLLLGTIRSGGLGLRLLEAQGASAEGVRAAAAGHLRRSA